MIDFLLEYKEMQCHDFILFNSNDAANITLNAICSRIACVHRVTRFQDGRLLRFVALHVLLIRSPVDRRNRGQTLHQTQQDIHTQYK